MLTRNEKIPQELHEYLKWNGFTSKWIVSEHPGCWDRDCSHDMNELSILRPRQKGSVDFQEGCTVDLIISVLEKNRDLYNTMFKWNY